MVKAQDVVRMYENMIQNLAEVPQLPGLEEDEELAATTAARVTALRYWRGSWTRQRRDWTRQSGGCTSLSGDWTRQTGD